MLVKSIDKTPKKVYVSKKHRLNTKEKSSDKFQSWKSGEILKISQYHFYILKSNKWYWKNTKDKKLSYGIGKIYHKIEKTLRYIV